MRKPDWLFEINKKGRVPVLQFNDRVVFESSVCNQYLEDIYPEPSIQGPKDPYIKARHGMVMDHFTMVN
jgi:glutathione S-transferase